MLQKQRVPKWLATSRLSPQHHRSSVCIHDMQLQRSMQRTTRHQRMEGISLCRAHRFWIWPTSQTPTAVTTSARHHLPPRISQRWKLPTSQSSAATAPEHPLPENGNQCTPMEAASILNSGQLGRRTDQAMDQWIAKIHCWVCVSVWSDQVELSS